MKNTPIQLEDTLMHTRSMPLRLEVAALGEGLRVGEGVECQHFALRLIEIAGYGQQRVDDRGMGPVELVDSVGIDVALHVSKILGAAMNRPIPDLLVRMVEDGKLGRKAGEGFYRWEDGKAIKPAGTGNVPADIEDRLILPMVNEAVAVYTDKVVDDEGLLDAGVIFGTGFAPFRGGPLNYARNRGIGEVTSRLEALADAHGERFRPYPGWSGLNET